MLIRFGRGRKTPRPEGGELARFKKALMAACCFLLVPVPVPAQGRAEKVRAQVREILASPDFRVAEIAWIRRLGVGLLEAQRMNASCNPPSTGNTCPVIFDDRSDTR